MSLYFAALNSGSNGNCYYAGNGSEAVLIDAGISCRETEKRMKRLGLPMAHVKAIFVSHEHCDHIAGIETLSKKYQLPVYITQNTLSHSGLKIEPHLLMSFDTYKPVSVGNLSVIAFRKFHDANDPHSFMVTGNAVRVGIFTDIGKTCDQVIHYFKQCHAVFLEANYDSEMLATGRYPYYLKKRISGGNGHLSNAEALQLFTTHRTAFMSHLVLSHLSANNNCPQLVQRLFLEVAGTTKVVVASRYHETEVYHIQVQARSVINRQRLLKPQPLQLSLF